MSTQHALYAQDFYHWTQEQAALLEARDADGLDFDHLAEEIRALGIADRRELHNRLLQLVMHLLKWRYQPAGTPSWRRSIREQRRQIHLVLRDSPSLRPTLPQVLAEVYPDARDDASEETGLSLATFPETCPWTVEQVLDAAFFPEP